MKDAERINKTKMKTTTKTIKNKLPKIVKRKWNMEVLEKNKYSFFE